MKVKKLIQKLYKACVQHDHDGEQRVWRKVMRKSLKHKRTQVVK